MKVPFTLLPGESFQAQEFVAEGNLILTSYRFYVESKPLKEPSSPPSLPLEALINLQRKKGSLSLTTIATDGLTTERNTPELEVEESQEDGSKYDSNYASLAVVNIPVCAIDSVEIRDIQCLLITTKYAQSVLLTFAGGEEASLWQKRLLDSGQPPKEVSASYCFRFAEHFIQQEGFSRLAALNAREQQSLIDSRAALTAEFTRMGFDTRHWRVCELNEEFRFSSTYPKYFIVPEDITDKDLEAVASFRYSKRVPAVCWRSQKNGCVILRSSQPVVGWLGWRSKEDERLLQRVMSLCNEGVQRPLPIAQQLTPPQVRQFPPANGHLPVALPHPPLPSPAADPPIEDQPNDDGPPVVQQPPVQPPLQQQPNPHSLLSCSSINSDNSSATNGNLDPTEQQEDSQLSQSPTPTPPTEPEGPEVSSDGEVKLSDSGNGSDDQPMNGSANSDTNGRLSSNEELPPTPPEEPEVERENERAEEVSNNHHAAANGNPHPQNGQNGNGQNGNGHIGNGSVAPPAAAFSGDESRLLILDARSYTAALANRAVGGGAECAEYYDNCQVQFACLANIHTVRKSFNSLRYLCEASQTDQQK